MSGIPSKDASFVWGTPRNYALTIILANTGEKMPNIVTKIDMNIKLVMDCSDYIDKHLSSSKIHF